jgi:hypothetical protein
LGKKARCIPEGYLQLTTGLRDFPESYLQLTISIPDIPKGYLHLPIALRNIPKDYCKITIALQDSRVGQFYPVLEGFRGFCRSERSGIESQFIFV